MRLRILAPTSKALDMAHTIAAALPDGADIWQRPGSLIQEVKDSIEHRKPTLAICALGIISRTLASTILPEKAATAPLVCASEDGAFFIPVLGGHKGANDLARELASLTQAQAVITTLSDQRFDVALDSPPKGWTLHASPAAFSAFMQELLELGTADLRDAPLWVKASNLPHDANSPLKISAAYGPTSKNSTASHLRYEGVGHLAVGLGCERNCPDSYIEHLIAQAQDTLGFRFPRPLPSGSIDLKADEGAFLRLAPTMQFFPAAHLNTFDVPTPSKVVFAEVGTHSVAEASALALAGKGGQLILPKIKNSKATLAVAAALKPLK